MAVHGFKRDVQTAFVGKNLIHTFLGRLRIAELQCIPQSQGFHVLPKRPGFFIAQLKFGRVGYRIVKAVVGEHIAQVVHINQRGRFAFDAFMVQTACQLGQAVAAKVREKQ